jgi:hypothetical protein
MTLDLAIAVFFGVVLALAYAVERVLRRGGR